MNALTAATASDQAKLRFLPCDGSIDAVCNLLAGNEISVKLAALKLVSNISVYPQARTALRANELCLKNIRALREVGDARFERHAKIAEDAVLWEA